MKNLLGNFILYLLPLIILSQGLLAQKQPFQLQKTQEKISINGINTEWAEVDSIILYSFPPEGKKVAIIKMLWDSEKLYFLFYVKDATLNSVYTENDQDVWLEDGIEFYISTEMNKSQTEYMTKYEYQFLVNLLNTQITIRGNEEVNLKSYGGYNRNYHWNTDFLSSVKIDGTLNDSSDIDNGYNTEVAVYWKSLNIQPQHGDTLRINLCVNDYDQEKNRELYNWANLTEGHAFPTNWPLVVMIDEDAQLANANQDLSNVSSWLILLVGIICVAVGGYKIYRRYALLPKENFQPTLNLPLVTAENVMHEEEKHSRNSEVVEKILRVLEDKYSVDIRTQDIAEEIGISERHLQRILKTETGKRFRELLNETRIQRAKQLLTQTSKPIKDIYLQVGYQDYSHFIRVFKNQLEVTPAQYREKFKEFSGLFTSEDLHQLE